MPLPYICLMRPDDGDGNVLCNTFIACDVYLPNVGHGVDSGSVSPNTVKLFKTDPRPGNRS